MQNTIHKPQANVLQPLDPPYSETVNAIFEGYPKRGDYLLKLFRVFANSERFLKKGTVNLLDRASPLSMRQRELIILRVTANNGCEYEWGVHVGAFGDHVGFTADEINASRLGDHRSACWDEAESLLVEVVDQLCACGTLPDALLQRFQSSFSAEEQLEVLALCGNYHTVSFVANVSRLSGEDFAASFPPACSNH